jgi:tRNA (cytidine/uridine-2'-O-)-methyltransferase
MSIEIALYQPEIPPNTGNIARTCAVTGAKLHLIKPLGFSIDEKYVKRAGLDYWHLVDVTVHESLEEFLKVMQGRPLYFSSTKARKLYTEVEYEQDAVIVFGSETRGLPPLIHDTYKTGLMRIPMRDCADARSLNLSNAVAVVLFEALRQQGFPELI